MDSYLIYKSLHLIAVISWMAGLLYLPRIFVYHAENNETNSISEIFKIMEKKLYFFIMYPAMILSWLFALIMLHKNSSLMSAGWMHMKITLVVFLTVYHFYLGSCLKQFKTDNNSKSSKFFRITNEIPTILLILIVFLAILKPF